MIPEDPLIERVREEYKKRPIVDRKKYLFNGIKNKLKDQDFCPIMKRGILDQFVKIILGRDIDICVLLGIKRRIIHLMRSEE